MPILSNPSGAARTSVAYITIGALTDVWSGVWYWYLSEHPPERDVAWYLCWGLLLTGSVLVVIGLALGRIGRAARHAELPPEEVTAAAVQSEQTAAARAPLLAPVNPAVAALGPAQGAMVGSPPVAVPVTPIPVASPSVRSTR
jgi:hypothetical protein